MAYKVLIVDDEPIIRLGLTTCIDWEKEGFTLVGEAANGEAALRIIHERSVDILITDIKMPLMDGLELVRQTKEFIPRLKVVLVSSYNDFEYAREAVKLGVVIDYLLKPTMEPDDLVRVLHRCKESLVKEEVRTQQEQFLVREERKIQLARFESQIKAYLGGTEPEFEWKPEWTFGQLIVAVWKLTSAVSRDEAMRKIVRLETAIDKFNERYDQGLAFAAGENIFVTLSADRGGGAAELESAHRRLQEEGYGFTVGISPSFHRLATLPEAMKWAETALEMAYFKGLHRCYLGNLPLMQANADEAEETVRFQTDELKEKFSKAFASGEKKSCMDIFEQYVTIWKGFRVSRNEIVSQARSLIMMMWSHQMKLKTEDHMQSMIHKWVSIENAATLDMLTAFLRQELARLWEPDNRQIVIEDAGGAHVIQLALIHIQENYRKDISLQEVADHVHMSKNYFSEQFKKRTGLGFIDFVIQLRIHYAKHLLETTSLKVHDIGVQSGFHSPKHFLKLFKRVMGCTPIEYRERCAVDAKQFTAE